MTQIVKDTLEIENNILTPQEKKEEAKEIPKYKSRMELSQENEDRLGKEVFDEREAMEEERQETEIEEAWENLDAQYDGEIEEHEDRQYNFHKNTTKIKIDAIRRLIKQALFESDPVATVSPYPGFQKEGGQDVCDKQTDFLDNKVDQVIPLKEQMSYVLYSAALKHVGFLKVTHKMETDTKSREELYEGNKVVGVNPDGTPAIDSSGFERFLKNYPDAVEKYPGIIKALIKGEDKNLKIKYKEIIYNDPLPKFVAPENFLARLSCNNYRDLARTRLTVETEEYTGWELLKAQEDDEFFNVDEVFFNYKKGEGDKKERKERIEGYLNKKFKILECVYYGREKEADTDEIKMVLFFDEESRKLIGSNYYFYDAVPCYYVPFYIKKNKPGLYGESMGSDLAHGNLIEDTLLNHLLEGVDMRNTFTPITLSEEVEEQFLEKRFTHGIPINCAPGEIDFLQKYMPQIDVGGMMALIQYINKDSDDTSGISGYTTGRESEVDPTAPAAKTIALLEQSGINVKDYVNEIALSFNEVLHIFLSIYHQISKEGRAYKKNPELGGDPFAMIERSEMIARTNIQSQATTFNFEKMNEKRENLAMYQVLRQELLIAKNPEAVYFLIKTLIKSWSKMWKNQVDEILPPLEVFKKQQAMVALQAVNQYVQAVVKKATITGTPPEFDVKQLMPIMTDLQAQIATPPSKEAQKAAQKNQQGGSNV